MKHTRIYALVLIVVLVVGMLAVPVMAEDDNFTLVFPQPSEETEFVDSWGHSRSGGRSHRGTDLMAPRMTPIVAAADGIVAKFGNGRLSGRYIVIEHADGYETWYMHMNNDTPGTDDGRGYPEYTFVAGLEVGDPVEAGQLIGYVGDSGNAEWTAPHTHFELHRDGRAINPYPYLQAAWERWQLELLIERQEVPFS